MKTTGKIIIIFSLLFAATTIAEEKCMICHGKADHIKTESTGRTVSLFVDQKSLAKSMHSKNTCSDCHVDIIEIPHSKKVSKVDCRRCHYSGNPVGAPGGENYDQYAHSVHGLEVAKGNPDAPVCQDCHGSHEIISHTNPESRIYKANIPKTCGQCHIDIFATYKESVHGVKSEEGVLDSPVCTSCHGEHNIQRHELPDSKVSVTNVTSTCSDCHDAMGVASKYGIKSDRAATFEDSFHGMAQMMASKTVANCSSCHGFHDIRSSDDPKSSIYPENIPTTCGKDGCHPEANANFASGIIHVDAKNEDSGVLYYVSKGFMVLTVSTLAGLFLFIMLDLFRRAKQARKTR